MPSYKLIYFDGRGRAEVCRLLFALADQKYEDFRFNREQWPTIKATTPFGQVPVLEIDGKPFAESVAIVSYLAREFGYYGKSNLEALEIDQVLYLLEDLMKEGFKIYFPPEGASKEELLKNFLENIIPRFMGYFEKMLKENGTGYFVGNGLTVADISVYCLAYGLSQTYPGSSDGYAEVKALCDRVESNDRIKAYLATRKPTDF